MKWIDRHRPQLIFLALLLSGSSIVLRFMGVE
jgi:hypothetical protein